MLSYVPWPSLETAPDPSTGEAFFWPHFNPPVEIADAMAVHELEACEAFEPRRFLGSVRTRLANCELAPEMAFCLAYQLATRIDEQLHGSDTTLAVLHGRQLGVMESGGVDDPAKLSGIAQAAYWTVEAELTRYLDRCAGYRLFQLGEIAMASFIAIDGAKAMAVMEAGRLGLAGKPFPQLLDARYGVRPYVEARKVA